MANRRELPEPAPLPDLTAVLWTVRDALEQVLFKLAELRLILATGSARWVPRAESELRASLEALHVIETVRAAVFTELAGAAIGHQERTLHDMVQAAPQPWPDLLLDHRIALSRLMAEIELLAAENKQLLSAFMRGDLADSRGVAGRPGAGRAGDAGRERRTPVADPAASASFRAALVTLSRLPQRSLQDFLA